MKNGFSRFLSSTDPGLGHSPAPTTTTKSFSFASFYPLMLLVRNIFMSNNSNPHQGWTLYSDLDFLEVSAGKLQKTNNRVPRIPFINNAHYTCKFTLHLIRQLCGSTGSFHRKVSFAQGAACAASRLHVRANCAQKHHCFVNIELHGSSTLRQIPNQHSGSLVFGQTINVVNHCPCNCLFPVIG